MSGLGPAFWEMFKDQIQIYIQRALRMLQYEIPSYNEWALLNHHQTSGEDVTRNGSTVDHKSGFVMETHLGQDY